MEVLFSNNGKPLSRLIRAVTHEESSHCALKVGHFVVHSTMCGPEIRTYDYFKKHNHIVASVPLSLPDKVAVDLITKLDSAGYDYTALLYLGLRYAIRALTGYSLPRANLWNLSGMYICTELVTVFLYGKADAMITPHQLLLKLKATKE